MRRKQYERTHARTDRTAVRKTAKTFEVGSDVQRTDETVVLP